MNQLNLKTKKLLAGIFILSHAPSIASNHNSHLIERAATHSSLSSSTLQTFKRNREYILKNRNSANIMNGLWTGLSVGASAVGPTGTPFNILAELGKVATQDRLAGAEIIYKQKVKSAFSTLLNDRNQEFQNAIELSTREEKEAALYELIKDNLTLDIQLQLSQEERELVSYNLAKQALTVASHIVDNQSEFESQSGEQFNELWKFNSEISHDIFNIDQQVKSIAQTQIEYGQEINVLKEQVDEFHKEYLGFSASLQNQVNSNTSLIQRNQDQIDFNRSKIARNKRQIENVARQVWGNSIQLEQISGQVGDNTLRIDEVSSQLNVLESDVAFNQVLIYGTLSDTQKLAALRNPRFLDNIYPTNGPERKRIEEKLTLAAQRSHIAKTASNVSGVTKDIVTIANNLHLFGDDQKKFNEIAGHVITAANVSAAIYSGNYLNAAVVISGLFAKKQKSPEQQRHEAIMNQLQVINQKLDTVLENQEKIFNKLVDIEEMIREISHQMRSFEEGVNLRLTLIQGDLSSILNIVSHDTEVANLLGNCNQFLNSRGEISFDGNLVYSSFVPSISNKIPFIDFTPGVITNLKDLEGHYFDQKVMGYTPMDCITGARRALEVKYANQGHFNNHILMASYAKENESYFSKLIAPVYNPLLSKFKKSYPIFRVHSSGVELSENFDAFLALVLSSKQIGSFEEGFKQISRNSTFSQSMELALEYDAETHEKALTNLIHPDKLLQVGYLMLDSLPYLELLDRRYNLLSHEKILAGQFSDRRQDNFRILRKMLYAVNYSIAQQRLLAGFPILPLVDRDLTGRNGDEARKESLNILRNNGVFFQNYLRYKLVSHMNNARQSPEIQGDDSIKTVFKVNLKTYEDALKTGNISSLPIITTLNKKLDLELTLNQLPKPQDLLSQNFLDTPHYHRLIEYRERLMSYVFHFDFHEDINVDALLLTIPHGAFK